MSGAVESALVSTGTLETSYTLATLNYSTTYTWRIDGTDGSCTTTGPTWSFTTMDDPNIVNAFMDDFNGTTNWTAANLGNPCDWIYSNGTSTIPGYWGGPPLFPPSLFSGVPCIFLFPVRLLQYQPDW